MDSVKWVKVYTDLFQDEKMKAIEAIATDKAEADNMQLTWVKIILLAGRRGADGRLMLTDSIHYTTPMLANSIGEDPVKLGRTLDVFASLDMIEVSEDGAISIPGWSEHQSVGGSTEAQKLAARRYRERKKLAATSEKPADDDATYDADMTPDDGDMTRHMTRHAPEEEVEEEQEKEKESEKKKTKRRRFVPPTPEQVRAYAQEKGLALDADRFCDFYASKGWTVGRSPMRDWKAAARNWATRDRASPPPLRGQTAIAGEFSQYD